MAISEYQMQSFPSEHTQISKTQPDSSSDAAMFFDKDDFEKQYQFMEFTSGVNGTFSLELTKEDIELLLTGEKVIVWGQGEYTSIIRLKDSE